MNNYFKKTLDKNNFKSIWLPNANLNEFKYIIDGLVKCGVNIEILFIPLFLDDTRNDSIREEILHFQKDLCKSKNNLSEKIVIDKKGNLQLLNKKIKNNLKFFAYLQSLNEKFRVDIYKLRNLVFNIKPSSIRSIRQASYESNINSLKEVIFERNENKLKTIIYIPPLLNADGYGPIPYSLTQYNFFKNNMNNLCKNEICIYLNLEKSVPNNLWGLKKSTSFNKNVEELDFMHFTGDGHSILANKFIEIIEEIK